MHSTIILPLLILLAGMVVLVPTIEDTGHRWLVYWLIVPPLVAGMLAACTHFGVS